jgi:nucleoside-diphosphate-sugar epimerase
MILISGTSSGLGRFIAKYSRDAEVLNRGTSVSDVRSSGRCYETIIHCAASISHAGWTDVDLRFLDDNIFLTRQLIDVPHDRFVYVSSIDQKRDTVYGISKRISERIVATSCKSWLIVRPSGLIGNGMKFNTFRKIQEGMPIALTRESIMNYVPYAAVLSTIQSCTDGVVTVSAAANVTMGQVAAMFQHNIQYGSVHYEVDISDDDSRLRRGYDLEKTSADNIRQYMNEYDPS